MAKLYKTHRVIARPNSSPGSKVYVYGRSGRWRAARADDARALIYVEVTVENDAFVMLAPCQCESTAKRCTRRSGRNFGQQVADVTYLFERSPARPARSKR